MFYAPNINQGQLFLDEEESRHCSKVLRKASGETILITDGKGSLYKAELTHVHAKKTEFIILGSELSKKDKPLVHIAIVPPKNLNRTEWLVEKATEIGVDQITFILSKRSERNKINLDRLNRISVSAMKQCSRVYIPVLNNLTPLDRFIMDTELDPSQKFIAYIDGSNRLLSRSIQTGDSFIMLIGPEGDFTSEEVESATKLGYKKVSMGKNILRTETAGIVSAMTFLIHDQITS